MFFTSHPLVSQGSGSNDDGGGDEVFCLSTQNSANLSSWPFQIAHFPSNILAGREEERLKKEEIQGKRNLQAAWTGHGVGHQALRPEQGDLLSPTVSLSGSSFSHSQIPIL